MVPKRPHDADVCMQVVTLSGGMCPQRQRLGEELTIPMNNSFYGAETLTGSKGMKTREQVTTQSLGNRIPKGINPMERLELTRRCMYWGICQYSQNYPQWILRIKIRTQVRMSTKDSAEEDPNSTLLGKQGDEVLPVTG